ncbi:MAG: hypothetical protein ACI965_000601 [Paraglaciecola sp.]|jgi:hypothetical protein
MIRLTQRGWNNVIIVSMLLLIVLFNTSSNFLTDSDADPDQARPLLPNNSVLMTLDFGSHKIERIGRGWRVVTDKGQALADQVALTERVNNWQQASIKPFDGLRPDRGFVVVVWLAGQDQARVYQFYPAGKNLLVDVEQELYQLNNMKLEQLVLSGLL